MNYGIELEFFVRNNEGTIIPAYTATSNLDGNPVIGELRTEVHNNIADCVFELEKLIVLESQKLEAKGFKMSIVPHVKVDNNFLSNLRKDPAYVNRKELEVLEEKSIYLGKLGKMLPRGVYKASLQINFSNNKAFNYPRYEKVQVEDKYKFVEHSENKDYSGLFDYVHIIAGLDKSYEADIKATNRIKGVYAIKAGKLGDRIEYRSLPNTVDRMRLLQLFK